MGGGGYDWQDRESMREKEAIEYSNSHTCNLDGFTTEQLQAELKKRKNSAKEKLSRLEAAKKHNEPLKREISKLQNELAGITRRLKREE
jgi:hypothetical protein